MRSFRTPVLVFVLGKLAVSQDLAASQPAFTRQYVGASGHCDRELIAVHNV